MAAKPKDPTEPIRQAASEFPDVAEGTSCTQGSFKVGKQAFLYVGPQGGRYKAMFKLEASRAQAEALAKERPDDFQAGSTAWVTARFSAEKPLPKRLWTKWLRESHALAAGAAGPAKRRKKAAEKKAAKKKAARRKR
jgi:hypothetical protein